MNQSLVIKSILNLNKNLHQLNSSNDKLSSILGNPNFEIFNMKIILNHSSLEDYFTKYCGMLLSKSLKTDITLSKKTSKFLFLKEYVNLLEAIRLESYFIERHIIASLQFKEVFHSIARLSTKQLDIINDEIESIRSISVIQREPSSKVTQKAVMIAN